MSPFPNFLRRAVYKSIVAPRHKIIFFKLKRNKGLWKAITDYLAKTASTGCNYSDYYFLYNHVRQYRPINILECGTGVSTVVMSYALMENEQMGGKRGRITSMENVEQWYKQAVQLLPADLQQYVDIVYSPKVEYYYSIFRGVGYKDIPNIEYDFVFIDGPETSAPSDGTKAFDFDFINIVKRSNKPVSGIIDKRLETCYVLQKVFGVDKVKYDPKLGLAFLGPCTKADIRSKISGESFSHRLRVFGKNELNLHMRF